jgi:hypothetical protein
MNTHVTGLILTTVVFAAFIAYKGSGGITAIFEWICFLYYLNFFQLASNANPYFDSVHEFTKQD